MKKEDRALVAAAIAGNVEGVKAAIAADADVNAHDDDGSALECAATYGHTDVVHMLLAAGADVHADNESALHRAALHGHEAIIHLLIAAGANVNASTGDGDYALAGAASAGHVQIVRILMTAGANVRYAMNMAMCLAARYDHAEVVRALLTAGTDVHANGESALYGAAANDHAKVARILLAAGADPVVLWSTADKEARDCMLPTLDACADAMTPAQRSTLAKQSKQWVRLRALVAAAPKNKVLHRR